MRLDAMKRQGFRSDLTSAPVGQKFSVEQIAENSGVNGDIVILKINDFRGSSFVNVDSYGYNAYTGNYGDLINQGIIDPAKVVRVALENAASVASMLLTTECVIVKNS